MLGKRGVPVADSFSLEQVEFSYFTSPPGGKQSRLSPSKGMKVSLLPHEGDSWTWEQGYRDGCCVFLLVPRGLSVTDPAFLVTETDNTILLLKISAKASSKEEELTFFVVSLTLVLYR